MCISIVRVAACDEVLTDIDIFGSAKKRIKCCAHKAGVQAVFWSKPSKFGCIYKLLLALARMSFAMC